MNPTNQGSLDRILWAGQWTVAIGFELMGMIKLGLGADDVRLHFGLAADATTRMLHAMGMLEVALALLVILPAILRILPRLSSLAAGSLGALALLGTVRPASAAGAGLAIVDLPLLALAAWVMWGRLVKAPVAPFPEDLADPEARDLAWAQAAGDSPRSPGLVQQRAAGALDLRAVSLDHVPPDGAVRNVQRTSRGGR